MTGYWTEAVPLGLLTFRIDNVLAASGLVEISPVRAKRHVTGFTELKCSEGLSSADRWPRPLPGFLSGERTARGPDPGRGSRIEGPCSKRPQPGPIPALKPSPVPNLLIEGSGA